MNEKITDVIKGKNISSNAPKVSVIIPAYNIAPYITETLNSVFAQTYTDYEIIIVNDGSKDTEELETALAPFFDKIIYGKQINAGASVARNSAISLARGELLAFLDGDDIWLPRFLESQIDFLEKQDLEMVYCDAEIFGDEFFDGENFMKNSPSVGAVTPESLITSECNVITSGTVLKKDLLERFGTFDVAIPRAQDFDLWFRLAKSGARIGYQREILLKYRVRPDNLSGSNVKRSERNIRALEIIKDKYDFNERETGIWEKQMALCEAEYELEKGKFYLANGEFAEAQTHIAEANKFFRKPKLSLMIWLINLSPQLAVRLFKKARPAEFSFIAPEKVRK
ncbi:hypothetical protein BH10ACI1_BH10ACI1_33520 [soil metagenome]